MIHFLKSQARYRSIAVSVAAGLLLAWDCCPASAAETCDQSQTAAAIDSAGEKLRQLTTATQPLLQAKLQRLKQARGWSDQEYEDKGYSAIEDERTAKLDAQANRLLARLDTLSNADAGAASDCSRVAEIEAVSLELQATVRTKSQYVLAKLDQMAGEAAAPATAPAAPAPAPAAPKAAEKSVERMASAQTAIPPPAKATPPAPKQDRQEQWSAATTVAPPSTPPTPPTPPLQAAPAPAPTAPAVAPLPGPQAVPGQAEAEGYTIDEIVKASSGLFGKVSANLARVLEHAFAKSGRPAGYILGEETGGAFIAGLRYGQGKLYLRNGLTMLVYWHGPSLGADLGAQGAATLFLVYRLHQPDDVFANFTGIEGSAFVVGGLGMTVMTNGKIDMTPIRSGIGLRIGANLGYVRFTAKPTWNPF